MTWLAAIVLGLAAIFLVAGAKTHPAPRANVYVQCFALCLAFGCAELASSKFLVFSDSFTFTMAARKWRERYWHPVNSAGFRDHEWPAATDDARLIVFIGDSFVAGTGIDDISDRFADRTAQLLGGNWRSVVLAQPGWGPNDEAKAISGFPLSPRVVVLSYFINDIEDAMKECHRPVSFDIEDPPTGIVSFFEQNSHLMNYMFWRYWRSVHSDFGANYWHAVELANGDPVCLQVFFRQLEALIGAARAKSESVLLVAFPNLVAVPQSADITRRVTEFAEQRGVAAIDLAPEAAHWSKVDLVVNTLDSHPSRKFHARVAELLAARIGAMAR